MNAMIIILITLSLYIIYFFVPSSKCDVGEKYTNYLRYFHFILLSIVIFIWILSSFGVYLKGYWTNKIIIWFFILFCMSFFILVNRNKLYQIEIIYFGAFFYFQLMLIPFYFIPFIGPGLGVKIYGSLAHYGVAYEDDKYRVQYLVGYLAPADLPNLYVKRGLLEYKEPDLTVSNTSLMEYLINPDSIKIKEINDKKIEIFFYNNQIIDEADTLFRSPITIKVNITK